MKKLVWLTALFLLVGCTDSGDSESSSEVVDTSTEVSSETIESVSSESSSEVASSEESRGTGGTSESGVDNGGEEGQSLTLYVPDTLRQDEGTEIYNDVISVANEFTETNANLGEVGLFTLSYTGYYIEREDGGLQAFFMGINRIGEPLKNLSFNLNFVVGGTPVWDNMKFTLDESEFGEHPNNTAMPVFLDVPAGNEELLMNATPEETNIEITDLQVN
ncbi:hypothetical protein [Jeotgalibaca ciconiae]|uniref:Uncharacterized protein n=1 Tax=Jeotgalibaca ciconiae TaxID=2496265 RepID=A0A3Q9BL30_9LACT|nr:hypothetical protein [Jeotgalibaca ciconiae]AZP03492.1 hypothetical protein EJN90_01725 [Jeotgalibaca ciconiae]HJB24000.1 hypothetical protein [Candidatus Jeotgalibaca pullicola]